MMRNALNIDNNIFEELRNAIDQNLKNTMLRMQETRCNTAKVTVAIEIDQEILMLPDGLGGHKQGIVPKFSHRVKAQIQLVNEDKGVTRPEQELKWDEDWKQFYLSPIGTNQTSLLDEVLDAEDKAYARLMDDEELEGPLPFEDDDTV